MEISVARQKAGQLFSLARRHGRSGDELTPSLPPPGGFIALRHAVSGPAPKDGPYHDRMTVPAGGDCGSFCWRVHVISPYYSEDPYRAKHTKGRTVVNAYILIQTEVGKAASVAAEIAEIGGVTSSEDVTGPYDVIVRAEAENVDQLGQLVVAKVQNVNGITRTLTCPVVHL